MIITMRFSSLACVSTLLLLSEGARADYVLVKNFESIDCTGAVALMTAQYPTGCVAETADQSSRSVKCANASFGEYYFHMNSTQCAKTGSVLGPIIGMGCVNGVLTKCVSSPSAYNPPLESFSSSTFISQHRCPSSLLEPGNALTTISTYGKYRHCDYSSYLGYSSEWNCNSSRIVQYAYEGTR
jgi:hypothetical protein